MFFTQLGQIVIFIVAFMLYAHLVLALRAGNGVTGCPLTQLGNYAVKNFQ